MLAAEPQKLLASWRLTLLLESRFAALLEDIHLVLVSISAQDNLVLLEQMGEWARSGKYPGLAVEDLPSTVRMIASVEIETQVGDGSGC